jgi:hypothetical protein
MVHCADPPAAARALARAAPRLVLVLWSGLELRQEEAETWRPVEGEDDDQMCDWVSEPSVYPEGARVYMDTNSELTAAAGATFFEILRDELLAQGIESARIAAPQERLLTDSVRDNRSGRWQFVPHHSVGPITFSPAGPAVRDLLAAEPVSFRTAIGPGEAYDELGVRVYYDDGGYHDELGVRLCYNDGGYRQVVECFAPARIDYAGVELTARDTRAVVEHLADLGMEAHDGGPGILRFRSQHFALCAPDSQTESVAFTFRTPEWGDGYVPARLDT